MRVSGSSPLARGLHGHILDDALDTGIIPARAGFTAQVNMSWMRSRDHPRSRGVYPVESTGPSTGGGSSPLARGLPGTSSAVGLRARIIPARAGFTGRGWEPRWSWTDHPRSRGVYRSSAATPCVRSGSSPLARGLLLIPQDVGRVVRIIPARAGFTVSRRRSRRRSEDHPRSRGVYLCNHFGWAHHNGSSPLARGLPFEAYFTLSESRIIPARAGFTGS